MSEILKPCLYIEKPKTLDVVYPSRFTRILKSGKEYELSSGAVCANEENNHVL